MPTLSSDLICGGCEAGFLPSNSSMDRCSRCSAGNYVPAYAEPGSCSMYACPAGLIDADSNASTPCVWCPNGTYVPAGSWGNCSAFDCPAGQTDLDFNPSTLCVACPLGSYSAVGSTGACKLCPAGTSDTDDNPATPCAECAPGTYAPPGSFGKNKKNKREHGM